MINRHCNAAQEERQIEELKNEAARNSNNKNIKKRQEKLDWMYEGAVQHGPTTEDYAMGKAAPMMTGEKGFGGGAVTAGTIGEQVSESMVGASTLPQHICLLK